MTGGVRPFLQTTYKTKKEAKFGMRGGKSGVGTD
jgi:hypothetical protein